MAVLTVQEITRDGVLDLDGALQAADVAGDSFVNDGRTFLAVRNADAGARVVTLDIQQEVDGQAVSDRQVSVPAGRTALIGPFPMAVYNDNGGSGGSCGITYDAVTNTTVGVFKLSTS